MNEAQKRLRAYIEWLKGQQNVNKKWKNKIIARLEEVECFTPKLYFDNAPPITEIPDDACICIEGATDALCPVHGNASANN